MELESLWYGVILWYIFGFMILAWYYAILTCICNINMILWYLQKTVQVCSLNFEMHFRISSLWLTLSGGTLEQGFARDGDCGNSLFAYSRHWWFAPHRMFVGSSKHSLPSTAASLSNKQKDKKTKKMERQKDNRSIASLPIRAWY